MKHRISDSCDFYQKKENNQASSWWILLCCCAHYRKTPIYRVPGTSPWAFCRAHNEQLFCCAPFVGRPAKTWLAVCPVRHTTKSVCRVPDKRHTVKKLCRRGFAMGLAWRNFLPCVLRPLPCAAHGKVPDSGSGFSSHLFYKKVHIGKTEL